MKQRANGNVPSGILAPDGRPVATPEQRALHDIVNLINMLGRELQREGIDPWAVLREPVARGFSYPYHTPGGWGVVLVATDA